MQIFRHRSICLCLFEVDGSTKSSTVTFLDFRFIGSQAADIGTQKHKYTEMRVDRTLLEHAFVEGVRKYLLKVCNSG